MEYIIQAVSYFKKEASFQVKDADISFGITPVTADTLPNPAELFLGSLSACMLKNVERFSQLMNFEYEKAEITVKGIRLEKPPRMDEIQYELTTYSLDEKLNIELLKRNIENFGTIFNTVKSSCSISGIITKTS